MQKGARTKVYLKHRYHKMACSMVYSKSLLMNVVKTFPIDKEFTHLYSRRKRRNEGLAGGVRRVRAPVTLIELLKSNLQNSTTVGQ